MQQQNKVYELQDLNIQMSWYIVVDNNVDICKWLTDRLTIGSVKAYTDYISDTTGTVKEFWLPQVFTYDHSEVYVYDHLEGRYLKGQKTQKEDYEETFDQQTSAQ